MNNKIGITVVAAFLILALAWTSLKKNALLPRAEEDFQRKAVPGKSVQNSVQKEVIIKTTLEKHEPKNPSSEKTNEIELNADNFEFYYSNCLQGEACLIQDPWALYKALKKKNNALLIGHYLTLVNLKMRAGIQKELYGSLAKKIIDETYDEPLDRDYALAEHYYLAGDLDGSVKLYLELEKKSRLDSNVRAPSKVNIANAYFDLGQKKNARRYYQQALDDHKKGTFVLSPETQNFVMLRLEELQY